MLTSDLDFDLPESLIATHPADPRDAARLLHATRGGQLLRHATVRDLPRLLQPGDLLVFNTTRVLPARFAGVRADTGGRVRGLYLGPGPEARQWRCMLRARRFRQGAVVLLHDRSGERAGVGLTLERDEGDGAWLVLADTAEPAEAVLARIGLAALPPYILAARRRAGLAPDDDLDLQRYQTVYAQTAGSVAAPTAGLHFTPALLESLDRRGIERAEVTLHVGLGTFKPVETERIEDHPMHAEWCSMGARCIERVLRARGEGRRVIAVGTTAARTLESYASVGATAAPDPAAPAGPASLHTSLLIAPGYRWRWTDGLLTNFHLPRSTLLAMVAALLESAESPGLGIARLQALYAEAVRDRYRFFSFGDAMLLTPP